MTNNLERAEEHIASNIGKMDLGGIFFENISGKFFAYIICIRKTVDNTIFLSTDANPEIAASRAVSLFSEGECIEFEKFKSILRSGNISQHTVIRSKR